MFKLSIQKLLFAAAVAAAIPAQAGVIATFDDLAFPPATNSATGLQWTNATSSLDYKGVTWDAGFTVVGDEYAVGAGGPVFGIPHSGHYFLTNHDGRSGMMLATNLVLSGAWFGRNQYYGFGEGGADQITITALSGTTDLASVVFDLPDSHPGEAEPLSWVNTGIFATLSGINGYRIDRRELGTMAGNWVADDFQFTEAAAAVPEPASFGLLGLGLAGLAALRRRKA